MPDTCAAFLSVGARRGTRLPISGFLAGSGAERRPRQQRQLRGYAHGNTSFYQKYFTRGNTEAQEERALKRRCPARFSSDWPFLRGGQGDSRRCPKGSGSGLDVAHGLPLYFPPPCKRLSQRRSLGYRLMAGRRFLAPLIKVRVLVPQPEEGRSSRGFSLFYCLSSNSPCSFGIQLTKLR